MSFLNELDEKERKLIEYRYYKDMTQTEVAKTVRYKPGTSKQAGKEDFKKYA